MDKFIGYVHPLSYLLLIRGVFPFLPIVSAKVFQGIYEQTLADYNGYGINNADTGWGI